MDLQAHRLVDVALGPNTPDKYTPNTSNISHKRMRAGNHCSGNQHNTEYVLKCPCTSSVLGPALPRLPGVLLQSDIIVYLPNVCYCSLCACTSQLARSCEASARHWAQTVMGEASNCAAWVSLPSNALAAYLQYGFWLHLRGTVDTAIPLPRFPASFVLRAVQRETAWIRCSGPTWHSAFSTSQNRGSKIEYFMVSVLYLMLAWLAWTARVQPAVSPSPA